METDTQSARVQRRGEVVKITVPHEGKRLSFLWPAQDKSTYKDVGRSLLFFGLGVPTSKQSASLIHSVYSDKSIEAEPEVKEARKFIDEKGLWVYSNSFWVPGQGVYVIEDPRAIGKARKLSQNYLEKALKGSTELGWGGVRVSQDETVRFAPHGSYKVRSQLTSENVEKDGFIVATFGVEGAKKFAEMLGPSTMRVHGTFVDEIGAPELSYIRIRKNEILGGSWNDSWNDCYAFGVLNGGKK